MKRNKIKFSWPTSCFLCGSLNPHPLCPDCLLELPFYTKNPIEENNSPITHLYVLFEYLPPINKLIHAIKWHNNLALLRFLARLMANHLDMTELPTLLVPVPLHWWRVWQRGYNQSVELAKIISQELNIAYSYRVCYRTRYTPPQSQLMKAERLTNLTNVFKINHLNPQWQHILLIDDVTTTRTTLNELAQVFLLAGVSRVDAWCCAKTEFH